MAKKLSFEAAMEGLESAVAKLEGGSLSLDESIAEFEKCIALITQCEQQLGSAKQRVRLLIEGADGAVTDEPFVEQDET